MNNHYAISKVERGKEYLLDLKLKSEEIILIGDTNVVDSILEVSKYI
ncbi:hypothetical protein [Sporanaerobacter acetigenes]|nr:hypothetical protein [Sporanaerobacter acetigenes]